MKLLRLKLFRPLSLLGNVQNKRTVSDHDNLIGAPKVLDFYQESIEKIGRDQFKKLVEKGLNIPVFAF